MYSGGMNEKGAPTGFQGKGDYGGGNGGKDDQYPYYMNYGPPPDFYQQPGYNDQQPSLIPNVQDGPPPGPMRRYNDVWAIFLPIISLVLLPIAVKFFTGGKASAFWDITGKFSLGNGRFLTGITGTQMFLFYPLILILMSNVLSWFANYKLTPRRVMIISSIAVLFISLPFLLLLLLVITGSGQASRKSPSGKGSLISAIIGLCLMLFVAYLILRIMFRSARVISGMVNMSHRAVGLRRNSVIPGVVSKLVSVVIALFLYYGLKRAILNSPVSLHTSTSSGMRGIYGPKAPQWFLSDAEIMRTFNPARYVVNSKGGTSFTLAKANNVAMVALMAFSACYLVTLLHKAAASIVSGFVATFLLLGERTQNNEIILKMKNPIMNCARNTLTTSFGSVCLFSFVSLCLDTFGLIADLINNSHGSGNEDANIFYRLCAYVIYQIASLIKELVAAVNTYSLVLNSIYGYKFSKCMAGAWRRCKEKTMGLISVYISYHLYASLLATIFTTISMIVAGAIIFGSSHKALIQRFVNEKSSGLCLRLNELSDIPWLSQMITRMPKGGDGLYACNEFIIADMVIVPIIIARYLSDIYTTLIVSFCDATVGCYVERPQSVRVYSDGLYDELYSILPITSQL